MCHDSNKALRYAILYKNPDVSKSFLSKKIKLAGIDKSLYPNWSKIV